MTSWWAAPPCLTIAHHLFPSLDGRGEGEGDYFISLPITSTTPAKFCNTSLFQNLNILNPSEISQRSLSESLSFSIACCPPSTSMIIFLEKQTKSTIYLPTGCCRRNLQPSNCFPFKCRHNNLSASVPLCLRFLARLTRPWAKLSHPHPNPPPSRGREY